VNRNIKSVFTFSLVRNSLIYVLCDGINKSIPFILLPFISYYLTPSDYGIITNFNVLIQILAVFCYLSTAIALPVMYHKLKKEDLQLYVSNMIIINSYATIFCLIILFLLSKIINNTLHIPFIFQVFSLIIVWFSSITNINMVLWRCEEKSIKFGTYQIFQSVFNALSTVLFVIILLLGWKGRIYSMIIATMLFGIFSFMILYKRDYIVFKQSKEYMRSLLGFAIPLVPHALSFWLKSGVDKILLTNMFTLTENGLYSVAMTWGTMVGMFSMSFNNAYAPYLYKKLSYFDKDKVNTLGDQTKLVKMIYFSIIFAILLVFIAYWVSNLFIKLIYNSLYHGALTYLPYIMLGQFFNFCYLMFVCFIHYSFKTKTLGIITISLSIFQIFLSYTLMILIGPVGTAISSAVIMLLTFFGVTLYAMKVYKLPWFLNK
jgi:O-antigen/teichoic acid export membrane protein